MSSVGSKTTIQLKNKQVISGIFHTGSHKQQLQVCITQIASQKQQKRIFNMSDISYITLENITTDPADSGILSTFLLL